ncbi:MAG TPA: sterol desaturase family protein [Pseudomonadota bacterium]|nr:sterol desaturase family protein [Xanthomonadales bacterium]HQW80721.1 sterol desaturase family protein [Pseudomonadota bacterium]
MNPIVYAIPVFFVLMLIEFGVARARGRTAYRINDTLASLALGTTSQITELATKLVVIAIYAFCYEQLRVTTLPVDTWWTWALGLLLYDFLYYWHHRMSHEVGILWATHVVHHSSEEFNLSTALRQTSTRFLLGWMFYLPMAVLGFPVIVFIVVGLVDLLYQYWIHTEQIGKLGWFDRVFASPSNHRVHHAVNDQYLDKNYGGILIVWDRLFGSFIDEDDNEPCVYGTRSRLATFSPLWANLEVFAALGKDAWYARSWTDKLRVFLKPPGWRPADVATRFPKPAFDLDAAKRKYDPPLTSFETRYLFVQFLIVLGAGTHCLAVADHWPMPTTLAYACWIAFSAWTLCRLADHGRLASAMELTRLAALLVLVPYLWRGS